MGLWDTEKAMSMCAQQLLGRVGAHQTRCCSVVVRGRPFTGACVGLAAVGSQQSSCWPELISEMCNLIG